MPKLIVIKGPLKEKIIDLGKGTVFCGRNPRMNDISIRDIAVSRKHLKIFKIGEDIFVEDLKSKHGTRINGKLIEPGEGFHIEEGDLITIGNTVMQLTEVSARGSLVRKKSMLQNTKRKSASKGQPKQERRAKKELELFYQVSELFKKQMNINKFFKKVLKILLDALPRIDNAGIFLFRNEKIQVLEVIPKAHEKSVARYGRKIMDRVVMDRKTVRMSNTAFESPDDYMDSEDSPEIGSVLCVPIVSGDEILGVIYIDSMESYGFRKEDQVLLNSIAGPMAVVIEKYWRDPGSLDDQAV